MKQFNIGHPAYPSNSANAAHPKPLNRLNAYNELVRRGVTPFDARYAMIRANRDNWTSVWTLNNANVIEVKNVRAF